MQRNDTNAHAKSEQFLHDPKSTSLPPRRHTASCPSPNTADNSRQTDRRTQEDLLCTERRQDTSPKSSNVKWELLIIPFQDHRAQELIPSFTTPFRHWCSSRCMVRLDCNATRIIRISLCWLLSAMDTDVQISDARDRSKLINRVLLQSSVALFGSGDHCCFSH